MSKAADLRNERISKGLCPNCGDEAAPYYLCHKCRQLGKIGRICRQFHRAGGFDREVRDGRVFWSIRDNAACDDLIERSRPDPKPDDRRSAPRLNRIRVDVEGTLIQLIKHIGRPCTVDELVAAWGQLRAKRSGPLVGDLGRIIVAQGRRAAKAAKRLHNQHSAPPA